MGDVVNLNQFRKQRARAASVKKAGENRARFGRTKDEKTRQIAEFDRASRDLDGKQRDTANSPEDAPKAR